MSKMHGQTTLKFGRLLAYPHLTATLQIFYYCKPILHNYLSFWRVFELSYVAVTLETTCNMMAIRRRCDRYDTIRTSQTGGDPLRWYAFLHCERAFRWMGRICYMLDTKKNEEGKGKEVLSIRWLGCCVSDWAIGIPFPAGYRFCFLRNLVTWSGAGSIF